jgi:replication factor C small subunit
MVKEKNIPHLLFSGNAGIGKTSAAMVIVNTLYNGVLKRNILELNASDERGIDTIRNRVKPWAKRSKPVKDKDGNIICEFQIVILDEVDNMTAPAQAALRRTMEEFHKNCRFILICNFPWKIIEPVIDRCVPYEFKQITPEEKIDRTTFICEQENIQLESESIEYICHHSNSMRDVMNKYLERLRSIKGKIPLSKVKRFTPDLSIAEKILRESLNGRFLSGRQAFEVGLKRGYNIKQIINDINSYSVSNGYLDMMKGDISLTCLESEKLLLGGSTSVLVIDGLVARLMKIGEHYRKLKEQLELKKPK